MTAVFKFSWLKTICNVGSRAATALPPFIPAAAVATGCCRQKMPSPFQLQPAVVPHHIDIFQLVSKVVNCLLNRLLKNTRVSQSGGECCLRAAILCSGSSSGTVGVVILLCSFPFFATPQLEKSRDRCSSAAAYGSYLCHSLMSLVLELLCLQEQQQMQQVKRLAATRPAVRP